MQCQQKIPKIDALSGGGPGGEECNLMDKRFCGHLGVSEEFLLRRVTTSDQSHKMSDKNSPF